MPSRIVKESIWTSPNLNALSIYSERHFFRLLPLPDDHGCCEVTPLVIKGRCYPLQKKVTEKEILSWNQELEGQDLMRTWEISGRVYAFFPTWAAHQRIRSLHERKTPLPPQEVVEKLPKCQLTTNDDKRCHSHLILNPILNLNLLPPTPLKGENVGFEKFWGIYPKHKSKEQAEKAWRTLNPNEQLFSKILQAVELAKTSEDWRKDGGKFIPYPASWIRGKRWLDEHEVKVVQVVNSHPRPAILDTEPLTQQERDQNAIRVKELMRNLTSQMKVVNSEFK